MSEKPRNENEWAQMIAHGVHADCIRKLEAAQAEIAARDERIAELLATADAERKIVSRIWERLGSPKYEDLKGRSIYDLIDDIQQERDTARARVRELEAALSKIAAMPRGAEPLAWDMGETAQEAMRLASATTEPAPDVAALERAAQALLDCHGERPDAWIALRSALASATTEPAPDVAALELRAERWKEAAKFYRQWTGCPRELAAQLSRLRKWTSAQQPGAAGKDAND